MKEELIGQLAEERKERAHAAKIKYDMRRSMFPEWTVEESMIIMDMYQLDAWLHALRSELKLMEDEAKVLGIPSTKDEWERMFYLQRTAIKVAREIDFRARRGIERHDQASLSRVFWTDVVGGETR